MTHKEKSHMSDITESLPESTKGRGSGNEDHSFGEPSYTNTQEPLPSYEHEPSAPSVLQAIRTDSSLIPPSIPSEPATQISSTSSQFPRTIPPPYTPSHQPHQILFAIPQTNPTPTAPLLFAYPPTLSTYGITLPTWSSFLHQISTHLAAHSTTSKRLLSNASNVASSIPRKLGKDLINASTAAKENLSHSAKQLNPLGVWGSVMGFTFGVTGALVGSIVGAPGAILATKPRTQMERVAGFLEERNARWLHQRGLHAEVLGMGELSERVGRTVGEMFDAGSTIAEAEARMGRKGDATAEGQMVALRPWIGELVVDGGRMRSEGEETIQRGENERLGRRGGGETAWTDRKDRRSFVRGAESVGFNVTGSLSVDGRNAEQGEIPVAGSSTDGADGKGQGQVLVLGQETLWLVFTPWENKK